MPKFPTFPGLTIVASNLGKDLCFKNKTNVCSYVEMRLLAELFNCYKCSSWYYVHTNKVSAIEDSPYAYGLKLSGMTWLDWTKLKNKESFGIVAIWHYKGFIIVSYTTHSPSFWISCFVSSFNYSSWEMRQLSTFQKGVPAFVNNIFLQSWRPHLAPSYPNYRKENDFLFLIEPVTCMDWLSCALQQRKKKQ